MRNRIKRQIREAYRKAAPNFFEQLRQKQVHILLAIIYACQQQVHYHQIKQALLRALQEILEKLDNTHVNDYHQKPPV